MKIQELTVNNFMPYRGVQSIRFPTESRQNVMLLFGENMRGKTSFLNAVRWCLYEEALDRDRKQIPMHLIANMDAREQGDWTFSVHLKFEAEGVVYDLRRTARPKEMVHTPRRDADFEIQLHLKRGDRAVRHDEVSHEINLLLPHQISRFFLFDAELLAEYQELLSEDSEQGKRIKHAIEQVLGVPALLNGKAELKALLRKAQEVLAKENKNSDTMRAQAEHYSKVSGELEALKEDEQRLRRLEEETRAELAELEKELERTEAAQRTQARVESLQGEQRALRDREQALTQERLAVIAGSWRDVLQPRLRAHMSRLERERAQYQDRIERRGELRARISQLKSIVAKSVCSVCEQTISQEKRNECGALLGELERELEHTVADMARVGALSEEIGRLARIGTTGATSRLASIDSALNRTAVDLTKVDGELAAIEQEVSSFDSAEVARQRARQKSRTIHLGRLQEELRRNAKDTSEREAKREQLSKLMARTPSKRTKRAAKEVQVYAAMEKLFSGSVDMLRDRLRSSVEDHATDAFRRLTTELTYSGLRINDSYGLSILDRDNRIVSLRSAGAEQIVALSLIDGLNRTARKRGPIIIDTPLGRLDPKHRRNVLEHLPSMAEQVVLLVHEGEIRRSELGPLEERVGVIYEIERLSSSHSRIVRT